MSNKANDELWDLAVEMVDERLAKNNVPEEARKMLILEVYEELMGRDPVRDEEEIL